MQLSQYLQDPGRRDALAQKIGTSADYLYQIATGRRRGRPEIVAEIVRGTSGVVSMAEIWPDLADAVTQRGRKRA